MAFAVITTFHSKIIVLVQSVIIHSFYKGHHLFSTLSGRKPFYNTSLTLSPDNLKNRSCKKNLHLYNTPYIKMVK